MLINTYNLEQGLDTFSVKKLCRPHRISVMFFGSLPIKSSLKMKKNLNSLTIQKTGCEADWPLTQVC